MLSLANHANHSFFFKGTSSQDVCTSVRCHVGFIPLKSRLKEPNEGVGLLLKSLIDLVIEWMH
eukprot:1338621-Amorphochlora_amoeboformis.AAC.1